MACIVGTGCMAASVIGAFAAVARNLPKAAAAALSCFGIAAELAAQVSTGPGSFKQHLFDEIFALQPGTVHSLQKIQKATPCATK